jgi:hypothetical protein
LRGDEQTDEDQAEGRLFSDEVELGQREPRREREHDLQDAIRTAITAVLARYRPIGTLAHTSR